MARNATPSAIAALALLASSLLAQPVSAQFLPTSGDELPYQPALWNDGDTGTIQPNSGTYNYLLNVRYGDLTGVNTQFIQPGEIAGTPDTDYSWILEGNEAELVALVDADLTALGGSLEPVGKYDVCPEGTFKVAIFTMPGVSFIAFRQDPDGYWSWKYGNEPVTRLDFDGNPITDPDAAQRFRPDEYGFEYYNLVGYFAVSTVQIGE